MLRPNILHRKLLLEKDPKRRYALCLSHTPTLHLQAGLGDYPQQGPGPGYLRQ